MDNGNMVRSSGQVRIYTWNDDDSSWRLNQVAHGQNAHNELGTSLAFSFEGKTLAIGVLST